MERILLFVGILCICAHSVFAQFDNSAFFNRIPDTLTKRTLSLDINSFNYVRNYEYFNAFQDGYTLFGSILEPRLHYKADEHLTVSVGAFLRKDFGDEGVHTAKPLITLKYKKANTIFLFGSLEGNVQRGFIEPLYDLERRITDPVEYGAQFITKNALFDLDAWIAWDKMIYKYDTDQEQITGGFVADVNVLKRDYSSLKFPLQVMIKHLGGQIDVGQTAPLSTVINASIGFKYANLFKNDRVFKRVFTENYLVTHRDQSPTLTQTFKNGNAIWLNVGVDSKYGTLISSYWKGSNFQSIKGTPIYQSVSTDIDFPNYTEKERSLFLVRYAFQKALLPKLFLDVRMETIFDLKSPQTNKVDFSNSFFLTYRETFNLFKAK